MGGGVVAVASGVGEAVGSGTGEGVAVETGVSVGFGSVERATGSAVGGTSVALCDPPHAKANITRNAINPGNSHRPAIIPPP